MIKKRFGDSVIYLQEAFRFNGISFYSTCQCNINNLEESSVVQDKKDNVTQQNVLLNNMAIF